MCGIYNSVLLVRKVTTIVVFHFVNDVVADVNVSNMSIPMLRHFFRKFAIATANHQEMRISKII
jgi:hypothetical protein